MEKIIRNIDKQIESNQGKNILLDKPEIFQFISETVNSISNINELNMNVESFLIDYTTDKVLNEFCRINQFYSFDAKSKKDLKKIYTDLFAKLRLRISATDEISREHYQKLKNWLLKYNSFAGEIYSNSGQIVEPIVCSEYSPELQIEILRIDFERIMTPVLDIGCGKQGKLVNFMANKGIDVYGIDRFPFSSKNLQTSDWLEYGYGVENWGTIISNLGFSNHFIHHNLREDGNYIGYGKTYMNILNSLKVGGSFHYAPHLPFIEKYLNRNQYELIHYEIRGYDFKTTTIKKLQ